jgi:hypothetical protein
MAVCPGPTATSFFEGVSTKMNDGAFDSAELVVRRTLRSFDQKKSVGYPGRPSLRVAICISVRAGAQLRWSSERSVAGVPGFEPRLTESESPRRVLVCLVRRSSSLPDSLS